MIFASWLRSFQFSREVVVAPNLFRNRTELGEADAETGQPACAVAHLLPVRLPPRVAVLLEQAEDLGLCHGTSLLSTDTRQRATWQGSKTMAGVGFALSVNPHGACSRDRLASHDAQACSTR